MALNLTKRSPRQLHKLASIQLKLGDLEGAAVVINRSLDMKKAVFGTTHHVSVADTALQACQALTSPGTDLSTLTDKHVIHGFMIYMLAPYPWLIPRRAR
jgi:hypothetical protein